MRLISKIPLVALCGIATVSAFPPINEAVSRDVAATSVNSTDCNGKTYVYQEFAGYGYIPSNARDKYGDTIGGIGSSIAIDKSSWQRKGSSYEGTLYVLPDRGWYVSFFETLNRPN